MSRSLIKKSSCGFTRRGTSRSGCRITCQKSGPQFPPYTIVSNKPGYSLRLYTAYPVVKMVYERRDEGFLGLGSYFNGENAAGIKYRETQPIVMVHPPQGEKTMELMIGEPEDLPGPETPPPPTQTSVRIGVSGGELLAVMTIKGNVTPSVAESARIRLIELLQKDGIKLGPDEAEGGFRIAQYGAVYSLDRLNEILLRVSL